MAITFDGNSTLQFYVNGAPDTAISASPANSSPYTTVDVGGNRFMTGTLTSDASLNGYLDELRIYNSALSGTDVKSVMLAGEGTTAMPTFNYNSGTYTSSIGVTITNSAAPSGASLRYTTDGSTPSHTNGTLSTTQTTGPISIGCTTTLKAIAYQTNWLDSTVNSATYVISVGTVAAPTFSVASGTYVTPQTVTLSTTTSGATIRYTTDGTTPTETWGTIGTSVTISSTTTLKAIAYKGCPWTDSSVSSATYTITGTVVTPTLTPAGGTFSGAQTVFLSTTTSGATIRYTTDGSTPTESHGTVGTSVIVRSTETLQAIAYESGWLDSGVATAGYTISGTATQTNPPPVGSPGADSGNGMDPRRIGVRPLGSYWGAAGEQIDTTSGNLNFSLPLMKVMSRGGWSVTFALSYNSQIWRQDSAGTWLLGGDVGYGLGWTLQAGSIVPIWSNTSQIDHYLYVDSTGAEYSLSVNTGGVWTGREGVYVSFDSNTNRLYFNDGSFWVMGSQSASGEQDAGTLYPTLIQDSNGNQITILYGYGAGAGSTNTSARLCAIFDPRSGGGGGQVPCSGGGLSGMSYYFTYNSDPIPHATNLTNWVGTAESYQFNYASNQPLNSPFPPSIYYGPVTMLQSVGLSGLGVAHQFQYDASGTGEMTQVTTPLGGTLGWQYRTFTYNSGTADAINLREVQTRTMASLPSGGMSNTWSLTYDDVNSPSFHVSTTIKDAGAGTSKSYFVSTQNLLNQTVTTLLPYAYEEFNADQSQPLGVAYTWVEENGNVHKYEDATTLNPNTSNAATKRIDQYRDAYGNVTSAYVFDFGNTGTSADWAYSLTYITDANYISRYVRNRLKQVNATFNGVTTPLLWNTWDDYAYPYTMTDRSNLVLHDSSYSTSFTARGNLQFTGPSNHYYTYDIGGVQTSTIDGANRTINTPPSSSTNYSLPGVLSNGNVSSNISYAGSWAVTSVVDSNGPSTNTAYDQYGRPSSSTAIDGATTNYTYTYNPSTQTATINNPPENSNGTKWKKITLDGFGRVIKVESGHDTTTVSVVDTQYAACACSPLGKLYQVSQPYAPGGMDVWTTYTYDGSGRTLTVTAPDGSVTRYSYQGNQTTVTDPAGKWKTTTVDAQGNLTSVTEPNPGGGDNFVTTYAYDYANHLATVTMTRPEGTQTRSFQYSGPDLTSATNPENGTVAYTYNGAHQVVTRTDARNQQTTYSYDSYGRLSQVQHTVGDTWTYYYDTSIDSSFPPSYTGGRLAAVTFGGFTYEYGYNPAGRVTKQRMVASGLLSSSPLTLDATYSWDNEGRVTAENYPGVASSSPGRSFQYQYDLMGRLNGMQEYVQWCGSPCSWYWATQVTASYGVAGEMTKLSYFGYNETRTYNNLLQLTRQTIPNVLDMQYNYTTGQNNGQISSSIDNILGETVNYTYDALKRLTAATAIGGQWGEAYSFDGFGNLTAKTVTAGSAPNMSQAYDPATNHAIGNSQITYDASGNLFSGYPWYQSYDTENRDIAGFTYDPSGKRVEKSVPDPSNGNFTWTVYFYDIFGKEVETLTGYSGTAGATMSGTNVYFGNRLVQSNGVAVATDRLGSVRANSSGTRFSYFPYGEERTATPDGQIKFGTYFRDANPQGSSNEDYADQRYYNPWFGRFNTPDPIGNQVADPENPISWNMYAYVYGDPVNKIDPTGLCPPGMVPASPGQMEGIVDTAESYVGHGLTHADGTHYVDPGGNLSAIDCSGLLAQALAGIKYTSSNFQEASKQDQFTTSQIKTLFSADSSFQVGDIIWFPGHAGIVTGVDDSGNVTSFVGSQTSTGPANVDLNSPKGKYWANQIASGKAKAYTPCVPAATQQPDPTKPSSGAGGGGIAPGAGGSPPWWAVPVSWIGSLFGGSGGGQGHYVEDVTSTVTYRIN